ncbi:AAA family ATPase [Chromohalobacter israelensis]|uniref:AAA family ATPase n=1 Tax=Chromohalobacter israelensis TaxID=141390 RepID=UPI0013E89C23|nr:AAA family ATPase [Chromohalobacter salexigens]
MKEDLTIENFLVIKKGFFEVKSLNVVIGQQAQGKSVIAKLLYFFNSISDNFIDGIRKNTGKRELDKELVDKFENYFPRYTWDGSSFEIIYRYGDLEFFLFGRRNAKRKTNVKLTYSRSLSLLYNSKKKIYQKRLEENSAEVDNEYDSSIPESMLFREAVVEPLRKGEHGDFFGSTIFIPASRSFFANLQRNIFTFLSSNIDIDPFLKEFGSLYEFSKKVYGFRFGRGKSRGPREQIDRAIQAIVGGSYEYSEEQDWIVTKGNKINLANASSGQQEALPMLLTLNVLPARSSQGKTTSLFIEEPEAHLFPTSQGYIVSVLSMLREEVGLKIFLTTHSPYILSALNNLIMAYDVVSSGSMGEDEFKKINNGGSPVDYDSVSAFTIDGGVIKSIKDDEYRMLGGDILDEVSEHFNDVSNKLLLAGE